jgi:hypothetical protein
VGVAVVAVLTALAVGVLSVEVVGETVGQPAGAVVGWSVAGAAWLLLVHLFAPAVESWRARRSARRTVRLLDAARDALRTLQNDRTRVLEDDVWSRGWT